MKNTPPQLLSGFGISFTLMLKHGFLGLSRDSLKIGIERGMAKSCQANGFLQDIRN
jgi:hypothetical protein